MPTRVLKSDLFSIVSGHPKAPLRCALDYFECKTVEDLQSHIAREQLRPSDFYRLRHGGNARKPGQLVLFLFPDVKTFEQQRTEEAILNQGAGI